MRKSESHENGVALLTVMLLFSIAALLAVGMLTRQQMDVVRTANMLSQTQAMQYALGGEELARQTLMEDLVLTPDLTYPAQRWARLRDAMTIEHGHIAVQIEDLQAKLNLNALLTDRSRIPLFQRLLATLGIEVNASRLVDALTEQAKADTFNIRFQQPTLSSVQALMQGSLLSDGDYQRLLPYITALPDPASALNLNTASDTLLRAALTNEKSYKSLMETKAGQGYITPDQLESIGNAEEFSARSNYFGITVRVNYNGRMLTLRSILRRYLDTNYNMPVLNLVSREVSAF